MTRIKSFNYEYFRKPYQQRGLSADGNKRRNHLNCPLVEFENKKVFYRIKP